MTRASVLFSLTLFVAACNQSPAPAVVVDATANEAGSAAAVPMDACAIIESDQRARLGQSHPSLMTDGAPAPEWLPPVFTHCYRTKKGAWGLEVEIVNDGLLGNWFVAHVDSENQITRELALVKHLDRDDNVASLLNGAQRWDEPVLFDYSGDGEEELIVTGTFGSSAHPNEKSYRAHFGKIWSFRNSTKHIEPYQELRHEGFENFYGVTDVDGDGRPDLLMDYFYASETTCKCGRVPGGIDYGPPLLEHAVAAGASPWRTDDEVARSFAQKACPEKPASLLARSVPDSRSRDAALQNVVCARIWGMTEAEVTAKIAAECGAPSDEWASDEPGQGPPKCPDREGMIRWAKIVPPVHLGKVAHP